MTTRQHTRDRRIHVGDLVEFVEDYAPGEDVFACQGDRAIVRSIGGSMDDLLELEQLDGVRMESAFAQRVKSLGSRFDANGVRLKIGDTVRVSDPSTYFRLDEEEPLESGLYDGQLGEVVGLAPRDDYLDARNVLVKVPGTVAEDVPDIINPASLTVVDPDTAEDAIAAPQVGDKVVVQADAYFNLYRGRHESHTARTRVGQVVEVIAPTPNTDPRNVHLQDSRGTRFALAPECVTPYVEEEPEEAPAFQEGDVVRVIVDEPSFNASGYGVRTYRAKRGDLLVLGPRHEDGDFSYRRTNELGDEFLGVITPDGQVELVVEAALVRASKKLGEMLSEALGRALDSAVFHGTSEDEADEADDADDADDADEVTEPHERAEALVTAGAVMAAVGLERDVYDLIHLADYLLGHEDDEEAAA